MSPPIQLSGVELANPRGGAPSVAGPSTEVRPGRSGAEWRCGPLDLQVGTGEVVLVVGAAGLGTSRICAAALGEVTPTSGRIELLGRDVGKLRRSSLRLLRRRVGIIPQDLCLVEDRSAQLNVVLPLEIDGIPRSVSIARAAQVLAAMELESEASLPVDCLSASARQRVAVARGLVRRPDIILADHPTSQQDADGAELVCAALAAHAKQGAAVLIFGRDPRLRELAEVHDWRQLALVDGLLRPLGEIELDGRNIEELLIGSESAPVPIRSLPDPAIPNVLPFPITARSARAR